jgi:hypothetical protein
MRKVLARNSGLNIFTLISFIVIFFRAYSQLVSSPRRRGSRLSTHYCFNLKWKKKQANVACPDVLDKIDVVIFFGRVCWVVIVIIR